MCGAIYNRLSAANQLTINKTVLSLCGIQVALYWSVLEKVLRQVDKKGKADDNDYFILDRKYMESETCISLAEQYNCDSKLFNLGILVWDDADRNKLKVSEDKMIQLILSDDPDAFKNIKKAIKLTKAVEDKNRVAANKVIRAEEKARQLEEDPLFKKRNVINAMQKIAMENVKDPEISKLLCSWVESVYSRENMAFLSRDIINKFKSDLNVAAGKSKTTALRLLEIAVETGWRNVDWCVNRLNKKNAASLFSGTAVVTVSDRDDKKATGIMKDVEF